MSIECKKNLERMRYENKWIHVSTNIEGLDGRASKLANKIESKFGEKAHVYKWDILPEGNAYKKLETYEIYLKEYSLLLQTPTFDEMYFPDLYGQNNYLAKHIPNIIKGNTKKFNNINSLELITLAKKVDNSFEIWDILEKVDPDLAERIKSGEDVHFYDASDFGSSYTMSYKREEHPNLDFYEERNLFFKDKYGQPLEGKNGLLKKYFKELNFENKRIENFQSAIKLLNVFCEHLEKEIKPLI